MDFVPEEDCRMDWLKHGNNISNAKCEFNCLNRCWNKYMIISKF